MHDTDPVFRKWSRSVQAAELLEDLGYKRPLPVQSMYIQGRQSSAVLSLRARAIPAWSKSLQQDMFQIQHQPHCFTLHA